MERFKLPFCFAKWGLGYAIAVVRASGFLRPSKLAVCNEADPFDSG